MQGEDTECEEWQTRQCFDTQAGPRQDKVLKSLPGVARLRDTGATVCSFSITDLSVIEFVMTEHFSFLHRLEFVNDWSQSSALLRNEARLTWQHLPITVGLFSGVL